ncbi:glycosyltransferase [Granulicella sp. 5B5]|uniref:glycosyltransferase family 2 protein n=1 Tax=Granulicella sp. 5B5 TaxID=1617967 RepID=UPI0015F4D6A1|nr:glycosyltransferase family 2 protein [Granulicella sp. 5B5]QMV18086.1 glycosyltransferase [Granulicella sp. 5B5]
MPLLSVAIVTFNEEANLARTLASVAPLFSGMPGEIIVVDSHSTDRTAEIARTHNATVIARDWPGFAEQKNFAIAQCTGEWVLSLDADEELTPELATEIHILLNSNPTTSAFYLKRRNLFLGHWIKHGGFYPDAKLRLFRRTAAAQFTPRAVHEVIAFDGPTATLTHDLVHHAYPTLATYIEHMDRYSTLSSDILVAKGRTSRALPAFIANVAIFPALTFIKNYVFRLGFLDGREGLLQHLYHSVYASWKYAKAWEQSHPKR